jgi:hypothetical protein
MNTRRTIWASIHGNIPKGWVVHNLNGDTADNRPENLAAVPFNPSNVNLVIAPYRERIRNLEKEQKLRGEK